MLTDAQLPEACTVTTDKLLKYLLAARLCLRWLNNLHHVALLHSATVLKPVP